MFTSPGQCWVGGIAISLSSSNFEQFEFICFCKLFLNHKVLHLPHKINLCSNS